MKLFVCLRVTAADGVDHPALAVILVDRDTLAQWRERVKQAAQLGLVEVRERRGPLAWFGDQDEARPFRTSIDRLCFTEAGSIYLESYEKHSDVMFATPGVRLDDIEAALEAAEQTGTCWYASGDEARADALELVSCTRVEYDLAFRGFDFRGAHRVVYIPNAVVDHAGSVEAAFTMITGHASRHLVHYTSDEYFTLAGDVIRERVD